MPIATMHLILLQVLKESVSEASSTSHDLSKLVKDKLHNYSGKYIAKLILNLSTIILLLQEELGINLSLLLLYCT